MAVFIRWQRIKVYLCRTYKICSGETEQKRSDDERKMYVFSQTSACMCLLDLEQYGECFKLTQQLRNENLSDDDREEVDIMYIKSGYKLEHL